MILNEKVSCMDKTSQFLWIWFYIIWIYYENRIAICGEVVRKRSSKNFGELPLLSVVMLVIAGGATYVVKDGWNSLD